MAYHCVGDRFRDGTTERVIAQIVHNVMLIGATFGCPIGSRGVALDRTPQPIIERAGPQAVGFVGVGGVGCGGVCLIKCGDYQRELDGLGYVTIGNVPCRRAIEFVTWVPDIC